MLSVIYCTRTQNPTHYKHIMSTSGLGKHIEVIEIINNGESLTVSYNRGLKMAKYKTVVFMHDDLEIESSNWGNKIIKHFEKNPEFGILGLAGTTDIPASGMWWEDRSKMVGIVNHKHEGKKWESKYSKSWNNDIVEVVSVDGLFFAVHKDRIKSNFDENVKGFHFYEINFMIDNYLKGVKIGVMFNIRVTHLSIGMTNQQWDDNRKQFVEKFKDTLPIKFIPDFYQYEEKNISNYKTRIKIVIQSSGDIKDFENLYQKIVSLNYSNYQICLISNDSNYDELKDLKYDNLKVFEGFYNTLPKNLSILKFEDDFIEKNDELIFFINDKAQILNNIFANFVKLYLANKNTFGCGFPMSYNENKTILGSSLEVFLSKENKLGVNLKDINSYYNVYYGHITNPIGNLSDCFVTTAINLKLLDWFKLNYETPLYFNEFSIRLFLKNKTTFNDTNSMTVQNSFNESVNVQNDLVTFLSIFNEDKSLANIIKKVV